MEPTEPATDPTSPVRPTRLTAGIVAGGAAVAMVLAGLGIASAQTDDGAGSTTTPPAASAEGEGAGGRPHRHHRHHHRPSLGIASTALGIPVEDLRTQLREGRSLAAIAGDEAKELIAALVADGERHLDDAVDHGRLTQAEADDRKATLQTRVAELVHRVPAADGTAPGRGHRGPGRGGKVQLATAAEVLGMPEDDLRTQLREGKSLTAIAGDRTDELIAALVGKGEERLARAVTEGKLTQAQADERKARLTQRITDLVHATPAPGRLLRISQPDA